MGGRKTQKMGGTRMKMKKTKLVMGTQDPISKEEAADTLWTLKEEKTALEKEYKVWDKYLKSKMKTGERVQGELVEIEFKETTKLEVSISALKAEYPDTYEECLKIALEVATRKYGRESLEKIGTIVPYQKRFEFTPTPQV